MSLLGTSPLRLVSRMRNWKRLRRNTAWWSAKKNEGSLPWCQWSTITTATFWSSFRQS